MDAAPAVLDIGRSLKELRTSRGLSLGEASVRADVSKSTLSEWENGVSRPRGVALGRTLDALEAGERMRAQILYAADPAFARIDLSQKAFGAPVDVGKVIRAMRIRRHTTQAELARAVGVTQATVARWESGDAAPSGVAIHQVGFALGASAEETMALACAKGDPMGEMPDDPEGAGQYVRSLVGESQRTSEVLSLAFEAELWRRSARDGQWDPLYCWVLATRANDYFHYGRLGEVAETARRAIRRATTPDARRQATPAVGALVALARHRGDPAHAMIDRVTAWADRVPDSIERSWMVWEQARLLAQMGQEREALDKTERAIGLIELMNPTISAGAMRYNCDKYRSETFLETQSPGRAGEIFPDLSDGDSDHYLKLMVSIPAWHAAEQAVPEIYMERVREWVAGEGDSWLIRTRLARIERDQARLLAA